jgi:branched-chain amino acid transport system substrate-binding protein
MTLKVGVLLPLTGDFSVYGKSLLNGLKLALSSNPPDQGKVELEVKDTEGDYTKAAQLCRDLIENEGVVCVIGPLRSESVVGSAVVAENSHIPLITPTASKEGLALLGDYVFQLSSTPERKGKALAEFAVRDQGFKDLVMLIPEGEPTESEALSFKQTVEELGGKILAVERYPVDTRDFSPYLREIKNVLLGFPSNSTAREEGSLFDQVPAWVDGLFITADQTEMYDILSRITNLNIFSTIIGTEALGNDQVLGFARNIDREMIFTSNSFAQNDNSQRQRLLDLYHELYKKEPDLVTMLGYDCMQLLLSVFKNTTSPEGIRNGLLSTSDFKGASGEVRFDPEGENVSVPIYRLEREGVKRVR